MGNVIVYDDSGFQGNSQALGVGRFDWGQISNDTISSLRVPPGMKVTLFEDVHFEGGSRTFTSDVSYVGDDFNDKASSIIVEMDTVGQIDVSQVDYSPYVGDFSEALCFGWIQSACNVLGIPYNSYWATGYITLCSRESSWNPNAINTTDGNANGPIVQDGHPQNCSRGIAQCIPPTFANYHAPGSSLAIYDPVANIAASMRYVFDRYGVAADGSNLAQQVQQADPNRPPHGY